MKKGEAIPKQDFVFKKGLFGGYDVYRPIVGEKVLLGWIKFDDKTLRWSGEDVNGKAVSGNGQAHIATKMLANVTGVKTKRRPSPKRESTEKIVYLPAAEPEVPTRYKKTRESWLHEVAEAMEPWFEEIGYPIKNYRIGMGDCGKTFYGLCERRMFSPTRTSEITISIRIDDPVLVASVLCHEMIHAALPDSESHSIRFKKIADEFGVGNGRTRYCHVADKFRRRIGPVLRKAGVFPHTATTRKGR